MASPTTLAIGVLYYPGETRQQCVHLVINFDQDTRRFFDTDKSQEFLFQWDPTFNILVDFCGCEPIKHKNSNA